MFTAMYGETIKLHTSLFRLRHAGRSWDHLLVGRRKKLNFEQCRVDGYIIWVRKGIEVTMVLAIHVVEVVMERSKSDCVRIY